MYELLTMGDHPIYTHYEAERSKVTREAYKDMIMNLKKLDL